MGKHAKVYIEECEIQVKPDSGSQDDGYPQKKQGSANRKKRSRSSSKRGSRNREVGMRGEDAAAYYLLRRGYELLERNWTCFAGEADIIAHDGVALVFVEVKTRTGIDYGFPAEAVDAAKRDKYEKIALCYLSEHDFCDMPVRFDVMSIVVVAPDRAMVRHHIGAFSAA